MSAAKNIAGLFVTTLAFVGVILSAPLGAQALPEPHMVTGMVGLALGQTARLNVVNIGGRTAPHGSCRVEMRLVNGDGDEVAMGGSSVPPGQAIFLDFVHVDTTRSGRLQLRGVVQFMGDVNGRGCPSDPSNNYLGTLEVFSPDGSTDVILPAVQRFVPAVQ
jgi:hypothetical protein